MTKEHSNYILQFKRQVFFSLSSEKTNKKSYLPFLFKETKVNNLRTDFFV